MIRVWPSSSDTVPPLIVPPLRFHEPVVLFSVSGLAALFSVPVILTVPAVLGVRLKVPIPAVLKVPPRLRVPPLMLSVPVLDQEPLNVADCPVVTANPLFRT